MPVKFKGVRSVTAAAPRHAIRHHRRTRLPHAVVIALLAFGFSSVLHLCRPVAAQADEVSDLMNGSGDQNIPSDQNEPADQSESGVPVPQATPTVLPPPPAPCAQGVGGVCPACVTNVPGQSAYEASLPVPTPMPGNNYVVQLVNESNVTILGSANAPNGSSAFPGGPVPGPVLLEPREGTWVMQPLGAPNNANVLTIDIPPGAENTKCVQTNKSCGANGPRFYPRTGCKYDVAHNLAQCETGACEGPVDCGKQAFLPIPLGTTGRTPVSIVEWTFNATDVGGYEFPDISLVDGVNLTTDIQALGPHCASKPGAPTEPNWLSQNQPLAIHGTDLREAARCIPNFQLTRGEVGQMIQGKGNPKDVVACFTNCGRYIYPDVPKANCDPVPGSKCYYWKTFCCFTPENDPDHIYTQTCTNSDQCKQHGACWDTGAAPPDTCACTAFYKHPPCKDDVCTHQWTQSNKSAQPPAQNCTAVTGTGNAEANACIGDDIVHEVFPGGYTWPNDPQTYSSDARAYRIIWAPGGTSVPITDSGPPPLCSSLTEYGYGVEYGGPDSCNGHNQCHDCDIPVNKDGAKFAGALMNPKRGHTWTCSIADGIAVPAGQILCSWSATAPTATPTGTPTSTPTGAPTPTATPTTAPTPTPTSTATPTPAPTPTPQVKPALGADPAPANFGTVRVNSSKQIAITLSNTAKTEGEGSISIGTPTVPGGPPFSVSSSNCTLLAPKQTCSVTVAFSPKTAGAASAFLTIPANASNAPLSIKLTGTGRRD